MTPLEQYLNEQFLTQRVDHSDQARDAFFRGLDPFKSEIVLEGLLRTVRNPFTINKKGVQWVFQDGMWDELVVWPMYVHIDTWGVEQPVHYALVKSYGDPSREIPPKEHRLVEAPSENGVGVTRFVSGYDEPWLLYSKDHPFPREATQIVLSLAFNQYNRPHES